MAEWGLLNFGFGGSCHSSVVTNLTSIYENAGSIPGLAQWVKDLVWLWLWGGAAAGALVRPQTGKFQTPKKKPKKKKKKAGKKIKKKRVLGGLSGPLV